VADDRAQCRRRVRPHRVGRPPRKKRSVSSWTTTALVCVSLLTGASAGVLASVSRPAVLDESGEITGSGRVVVLEPEKWVGKPLPLLAHIDIGPELQQGEWIIVLYRRDCRKCHELLERLEAESRLLGACERQVALVELSDYAVDSRAQRDVTSWALPGRLDPRRRWHAAAPTLLHVENGQVVAVSNGDGSVPGT